MSVTSLDRQSFPAWAELKRYEINRLDANETLTIEPQFARLKIVVVRGLATIAGVEFPEGKVFDAEEQPAPVQIMAGADGAVIVPLHGTWGTETGGSGVFNGSPSDSPTNSGTPVDYDRHTNFDNHYHDCDEYWIVIEGEAVTVSEGTFFHVQPGDCLITGAGDHHDIPEIRAPLRAVYFETSLLGQKRLGHLWEHTHGNAVPVRR
jgi:mannose-6-phosphate isomerase-like protein (cupin superfamily)